MLISKKNLNIINIVSYTFPFIGSGIGNVALNEAEYIAKKNHTVYLISSNIPQTKKTFIRNKVIHIKINAINFLYKYNIPIPLFFFPKGVINTIKNSDIVHVHDIFYPSSFFGVIFAQIYRKPVFLTQHIPYVYYSNAFINFLQRIAFYTIGKYILWYSSKIFYFNPEVKELFDSHRKKMIFLKNGIDISLFHPVDIGKKVFLRKKYNFPINKPIILFVGRLVPKKGFDLLYYARSKEYLIVFVGGGNIPSEFNDREDVAFLGEKSQIELSELYQLSDIFVLPSQSEGYPLSVQEAMASGLPIIVSNLKCYLDVGLNSKLVKLIVPSVENIQKTIFNLLSNPYTTKLMSRYSRDYMLKSYSWEKHVDILIKEYEEAYI